MLSILVASHGTEQLNIYLRSNPEPDKGEAIANVTEQSRYSH